MPQQPSQPRRSTRLSTIDMLYYGPSPNRYFVFDIVDRETEAPFRSRVKWWGYKDPRDDTWEKRTKLIADGFTNMVAYIDLFKAWQGNAEDGECERSLSDFKKKQKVPRTFTADNDRLCYVESLRTVAKLLDVTEYLPDQRLEKFWQRFPSTKENGISWQDLMKLIQFCNIFQKKDGKGITFGGGKKKVNRISKTLSGKIELEKVALTPGVYLCGVSSACSGHMFVLCVKNGTTVYDSMYEKPQSYDEADYSWVIRWNFIVPCKIL